MSQVWIHCSFLSMSWIVVGEINCSILHIFVAVSQEYSTKAEDEYVIKGNDVLVKCKIPSFVSDFVSVIGWVDNEDKPLYPGVENSKKFLKFILLTSCFEMSIISVYLID